MPRLINLTGVFQPVDGQPPRAVETVTLAIYAEPTGGAPLWQETQSVAVDSKGRYALLLGATSAEGLPAAVFAAGRPVARHQIRSPRRSRRPAPAADQRALHAARRRCRYPGRPARLRVSPGPHEQ